MLEQGSHEESGMEVPEGFAVGTQMPSGTYPDQVVRADPSGAGHDGTYPTDLLGDAKTRAPEGAAEEGVDPTGLVTAEVPGANDGIAPAEFISAWAGDANDPRSLGMLDTP